MTASYLTGALLGVLGWWLENGVQHSPEVMGEKVYALLVGPTTPEAQA